MLFLRRFVAPVAQKRILLSALREKIYLYLCDAFIKTDQIFFLRAAEAFFTCEQAERLEQVRFALRVFAYEYITSL